MDVVKASRDRMADMVMCIANQVPTLVTGYDVDQERTIVHGYLWRLVADYGQVRIIVTEYEHGSGRRTPYLLEIVGPL